MKKLSKPLFILFIGVLLAFYWFGWLTNLGPLDIAVLITLLGGYKIFGDAVWGLLHREISSDLAIAIAAGAALYIGQYFAAAEVIFIMLIGGYLEELAVDKTRGAIEKLIQLVPPTARVRRGMNVVEVAIEDVRSGDVVVVRPGERIAVDGDVVGGTSAVDQSSITGESIPVNKASGDKVFAGTINQVGALDIRVIAVGKDSTLGKIVHLVEEAEEKKASVHQRADKWAVWFVPSVMALGFATFLLASGDVNARLIRAVSVLIVACPCALVLATPTGIAAGIGRLARAGVLVKGGVYLEALANVRAVVFDKTGTLTIGKPRVVEVVNFAEARDGESRLLALAASVETHSEHPLAQAIVAETQRRGIECNRTSTFHASPGLGGVGSNGDNDQAVTVGNRQLFEQRDIRIVEEDESRISRLEQAGHTVVLIAQGNRLCGAIGLSDTPREEAVEAVSLLRKAGIDRIALLSGDNERVARVIGSHLGIGEIGAGLLPSDKVARIRALQERGLPTLMCGDGINDAPSLAAADVGVAMRGLGSDITLEAADVVLMTDDLRKIPFAIEFSRHVVATIQRNIWWFAIAFNGSAVFAASQGWLGPIGAAVTHQIASLLVVCNSLRLLASNEWLRNISQFCLARIAGLRVLAQRTNQLCSSHPYKVSLGFFGVLVATYLVSGFTAIGPDQVGVRLHFRRDTERLQPGLHYVWPWPCDQVVRLNINRVQRVQVGFRAVKQQLPTAPRWSFWQPALAAVSTNREPVVYEWNYEHKGGFQFVPDEAMVVAGDENFVAMTMVVHYRVSDPGRFLFASVDPASLVKAQAEAALRDASARQKSEALLTTARVATEELVRNLVQRRLDSCGENGVGVVVERVCLQDVHPPIELVEAYRDVASAVEEKSRLIDEAEAYRNEQLPLARGNATNAVLAAEGARDARVADSQGRADRFAMTALAAAAQRKAQAERFYLEMMEELLPGQQIYIIDKKGPGMHQLYLLNDRLKSLLNASQPAAVQAPQRSQLPEE